MTLLEVNLNDVVTLKVTEIGRPLLPADVHINSQGKVRMQLWEAMQAFGPLLFMGSDVPVETTIFIERSGDSEVSLLKRVEKMLTALEFAGKAPFSATLSKCPSCGHYKTELIPQIHAPDCALAALLADVRKELEGK